MTTPDFLKQMLQEIESVSAKREPSPQAKMQKQKPAPAKGKANGKPKPEAIDRDQGAAILDDVRSFLTRFIVYPSAHALDAHVLWIAHAHLMGAWESTPRIAFLSPEPASGKTRSMEVSELLVPDPVAAVNVTPAYLFRKCGGEDGPPTILFDEIDTVFGAKAREHEELRALLNSGHRVGAKAGRCVVRGKTVETEEISSYAAVALAGLGWLPDTILSRSIIIRMRRRAPDERVEPYRRRVHAPVGEALRKRLAGWAVTVLKEATEARPDMPIGVEDRAADMWEPLLAVADIAGGDWPERARKAAVALVTVAREVEPSLNLTLLADLRTIYADRESVVAAAVPAGLSTKVILTELCRLESAPWNDIKGKPLSDNQLGRRLRHYEIRSKNLKPHGEDERKGYLVGDLVDAWRRYLPPLSEEPVEPVERVEPTQYRAEYSTAAVPEAVEQPVEPSNPAAQNPPKSGLTTASTGSTAFQGDRGDPPAPVCAQCGADGGNMREVYPGVRLHHECVRFYPVPKPDDDLTVPDFLNRNLKPNGGGEPDPDDWSFNLDDREDELARETAR
jgi:hypothetical protein